MTGAEALSRWTGRMGLRKANAGRKCACWVFGRRCAYLKSEWRQRRPPHCFPPGAAHLSVWGLGPAPAFEALRALCSHPLAVDEAAVTEWCARRHLACWRPAAPSWRGPGATLQVFVNPARVADLAGRTACPGCRATDRWRSRACCGIGDLAAWWDAEAVAVALMRGGA